ALDRRLQRCEPAAEGADGPPRPRARGGLAPLDPRRRALAAHPGPDPPRAEDGLHARARGRHAAPARRDPEGVPRGGAAPCRAPVAARGHLRARRPPARRRPRDRAAAGGALRRLVGALPPRGVGRGDGGARPRSALLPPPATARREAPLGPPRRRRQPEVPPPGPGPPGG